MITNLTGLPQPIVSAVIGETRDIGASQFSVTDLLSPPRQRYLKAKYTEQIHSDAADAKDTFLGTALDDYVRRYAKHPWESCERKFITIEVDGIDYVISGEADLYDHATKTIVDLKVTGTYEFSHPKIEKRDQLAMYAYIYGVHGYQVEAIANGLVMKDWSVVQAQFKKDYPPHGILMHYWDLPSMGWVEEFIKERIRLHVAANDDTMCTDLERWVEDKHRVIKVGATRAVNGGVFDNLDSAEAFRDTLSNPEEYEVQFEAGEPRRCQHWCPASSHCEQYQQGDN